MNAIPESKLLHEVVCGDQGALLFINAIYRVSHLWDDLIDKDKPLSKEQINSGFRNALIDIPSNPFFAAHAHRLIPVMSAGISAWQAANAFELTTDKRLWEMAHTLRYFVATVIVTCAEIVGGGDWADEVAPRIWAEAHKDTLDNYFKELEARHA